VDAGEEKREEAHEEPGNQAQRARPAAVERARRADIPGRGDRLQGRERLVPPAGDIPELYPDPAALGLLGELPEPIDAALGEGDLPIAEECVAGDGRIQIGHVPRGIPGFAGLVVVALVITIIVVVVAIIVAIVVFPGQGSASPAARADLETGPAPRGDRDDAAREPGTDAVPGSRARDRAGGSDGRRSPARAHLRDRQARAGYSVIDD